MAHWLIKSEPGAYSIADLERDGRTGWTGVRNYQARNHMRAMKVGDKAIVYHSNADPSGAAGVAQVVRLAYPDPTQFDRKDSHFDPKATSEKPVWDNVDVRFVSRFKRVVPLSELNDDPKLSGMLLTSGKASRLSVQPVDKAHFDHIVRLGKRTA